MNPYARGYAAPYGPGSGGVECEDEYEGSAGARCVCARRGDDAFSQAGSETLAQALDGESMDFDSMRQAWSAMPPDLKRYLFALARQSWDARGVYLSYLVATAYSLIRGGMPPVAAMRTAALQLRIPPRRETQQKGLSPSQVRQYHQRQQQRGRRPGQNPQQRGRLQREAEWQDAPGEHRLIPPWELITKRISSPPDTGSATGYRGVTKPHRQWARDVYGRMLKKVNESRAASGLPPLPAKPVTVGHLNPFTFTPPGAGARVRPQESATNKSEGKGIAQARQARIKGGLYVRKTQK